jgi:phosphoesterase RecJ-like protein
MSFHPDFSPTFAAILRQLGQRPVAVVGHVRPDGDCIGSQVALARVLRELGHDAVCYNGHAVPEACAGFVGDTPFVVAGEGTDLGDRAVLAVDCADRSRFGEILDRACAPALLNIDHHVSNSRYATHNLVDPDSAATAEILAGMLLDNGQPIDPVTANALYVGIATDTGQFRYASTSRRTFAICCRLMDHGADPAAAAHALYERESPAKLALLQHFLASLRFACAGRACIGVLGADAWAATGARKEHTEGLVDYARAIAGVEIGVLLEERDGMLKGSLRAKDARHRVDQLARKFNGGGHPCAAGFNPRMPLAEFYPILLAELAAHFSSQENLQP